MSFVSYILKFVDAMLISNIVLMGFLGICSFVGVSTKVKNATGMSMAVTVVVAVSVLITYPLQVFVLKPLGITYTQTIVFIVIIATLVQLMEMVLKAYIPSLYKGLGVYLALISTNCLILNTNIDASKMSDPLEVVALTLGVAAGYFLVMVIFSAIRERLETGKAPKAFKGVPLALVTTSIMAIAFTGLKGII